jgi:hypothetical protein
MLLTAARLAAMGAKLPINTLVPLQPDAMDESADEAARLMVPPSEDCSSPGDISVVRAKRRQSAGEGSDGSQETCNDEAVDAATRKIASARPVQERPKASLPR